MLQSQFLDLIHSLRYDSTLDTIRCSEVLRSGTSINWVNGPRNKTSIVTQ
ncbi:hypothetical protein BH09PAT4_BH09PAT4_09560 [soil metagenome]